MIKYLAIFFVSMVPLVELRLAMPIAVGMDLPYIPALIVCVLGNMVPIPGTGAWAGTLGASFLNMGFKSTVLSVCLGLALAGCIMAVVTTAGLHIFGL